MKDRGKKKKYDEKMNVWRETKLRGFEETYKLEKKVLEQTFGICKCTRK